MRTSLSIIPSTWIHKTTNTLSRYTPPWTEVKASVHDVTGIGSHKSQQTACRKQSAVPSKPQCGGPTGNPLKSVSKKWLQPWPRTTMCRSSPSPRNVTDLRTRPFHFNQRYRLWLRFLIVPVLSVSSRLKRDAEVQINK